MHSETVRAGFVKIVLPWQAAVYTVVLVLYVRAVQCEYPIPNIRLGRLQNIQK